MAGCSTAGEIGGSTVKENSASISFIEFEKTKIVYREQEINNAADSLSSGAALIESLDKKSYGMFLSFPMALILMALS